MSSRLSKQPSNPNQLRSNAYELQFQKIPELRFNCQAVNIPEISLEYHTQPTVFHGIHIDGAPITYAPLSISFLVSEDMSNWIAIHNWIRSLTNVENFTEYEPNRLQRESDATITILSNKLNPTIRFKFKNCMPKSLGGLDFLSTGADSTDLSSTMTLVYQSYEIEVI